MTGLKEWWRDVVRAMPTVRALTALRRGRRRELGARVVGGLVALYAAIALATPHCSPLQRRLLESSHLRPASMASWVALQPAPKMYGFANRAFRGPRSLVDEAAGTVQRALFERGSFWVNHYPARMARFDGERGRVFARPGKRIHVLLRSRYRGSALWTALVVEEREGALVWQPVWQSWEEAP